MMNRISVKGKYLFWLSSVSVLLIVSNYIRSCNGMHARPNDLDIAFDISPRGDQVVFTGSGNGKRDLFTLNLKTLKVVQLTDTPAYEGDPAFSPSGQSIAYADGAGGRADHIFTRSIDGANIRQLTNEDYNDREPRFSPDGKSIVFVRDHRYISGGMVAWGSWWYPQLYTIRADGTRLQRVTAGKYYADSPKFSPEGKSIVFNFKRNPYSWDETEQDVGYIKYDEGAGLQTAKQLTNDGYSSFPATSSDGKRLVFVSYPPMFGGKHYHYLYIMNRDGTEKRQLAKSDNVIANPVISPDNRYIYFILHSTYSTTGSTINGLWRVNINGANLTQIANGTLFLNSALWKIPQ